MPLAWANKKMVVHVHIPQPEQTETVQEVIIPTYDKISVLEHKNGKLLDDTSKKDNEVGSRKEEGNGKEMVFPCVKDSEGSL
jgi:hypothetical protein